MNPAPAQNPQSGENVFDGTTLRIIFNGYLAEESSVMGDELMVLFPEWV